MLKEAFIDPGQTGTFDFSFTAPINAVANDDFDNPETSHSEYFYREDLTLAWGPNWMDADAAYPNGTGDPLGRAHVWLAVRVETQ